LSEIPGGVAEILEAEHVPHKPGESGQGSVDVRPLGNMPSSPELQKKMAGDRKPAVAVP